MKKIIIVLFIISVIFLLNQKSEVMIPRESIRFRILANSNSIQDQALKNEIKDKLIDNVFSNYNYNDLNSSKEVINDSIPKIKEIINKYDVKYKINFGNNFFPEKEYKGIRYPQGNYESLVITLEEGKGDNFWCVLYPPLCLVENEEDTSKVEYKSIINNIINKYINHME